MGKRNGIMVICAVILVLSFVEAASAMTWSVDDDSGAEFTGIQDAINNAKDGDTIIVYSGVYYGNVVVDKSITLIGINLPIVDARGEGNAITLRADGTTLEGFNATNSGYSDVGIAATSNNNTITGNNVCNNGGGIYLDHSSNNTITGNNACNNNFAGISLSDSSNNTITGNNVSNNNGDGISLRDSSNNNTITGNNVSNNDDDGISFDSSSNNIIRGNTFVNGGLHDDSYQSTVEDNIVNGKPLVYLEDVSDYKVEDAGQVILVNCNNITVENLDLSNTSVGIELWKTENSKILNNTVSNNRVGISLDKSCYNIITGNNASNNGGHYLYGYGIYLDKSCYNIITGNNVCINSGGIYLSYSSNNTIRCNYASNNNAGIWLYDSRNNTITSNNASNNKDGIWLSSSSNNKIYLNNLINNADNVFSYDSTNIWNSPLKITYTYDTTTYESYLGNYWSDYEGTDADGDGIGDIHYTLVSKGDESDEYPLMNPYENYYILTSAHA